MLESAYGPLLPSLSTSTRRGPTTPGSFDGEAASISSESDSGAFQSASVLNGMETVVTNHLSRASQSQTVSRRDYGMLREMNLIIEDIFNKTMPPEETDMMIRRLEKRADSRQQRSYVAGEPMAEVQPHAVVLNVGFTFLTGADKPQVTRCEERDMAGGKPDQKDASWRVNTAGALLTQVDISEDLAVVQNDQTAMIAKHANHRVARREGLLPNRTPP